jgi:hypothetical protein
VCARERRGCSEPESEGEKDRRVQRNELSREKVRTGDRISPENAMKSKTGDPSIRLITGSFCDR